LTFAKHFFQYQACGRFPVKIMLEVSPGIGMLEGRQSSGVRNPSFTAMNSAVSSEAACLQWFMKDFLNRLPLSLSDYLC